MIKIYSIIKIYILTIALLILSVAVFAQETRQLSVDKPDAIADLKTIAGAALVNAKWYVQPAYIQDKNFNLPGPQKDGDPLPLYPTGAVVKTHTLHPQITDADFDKAFTEIKPTALESRQGTGLFSFVWYKTEITIPQVMGKLNINGATAVFEIVVDDYSEVWVNGKQAQGFGQAGNGVIAGYNTRNRVLLTDDAKPGQKFSIAILGINGTMGKLPDNYIWIRNAVIDFYKNGLPVNKTWGDIGKIYTLDTALNSIIVPGTKIEKVADGFSFTEGPVWHPDGYLLFSVTIQKTITLQCI